LIIHHPNIKTEYVMSVKSLSELESVRGGPALKARLKHVDDRLNWFGFLRLADHAAKFGISDVQAKIDIKTYRYLSASPPPERKPGPAVAGALGPGIYLRPDKFIPVFDVPGSLDDLWLTRFPDARPGEPLSVELLYVPEHRIEPDDVRALLAATELLGSCRLKYQSMTSTEASERIVCPHAVVKASGRYHVRAFDFSRKRFIDFSLSRVLSSDPLPDHAPVPSTLDDDWHKTVEVEFLPHPRLSPTQRSTIAREYGMQQGLSIVTVRRAMLFYLLDEMRLLKAIRQQDKDLADIPVWVKNSEQIADELATMEDDN
jgi:WYL domain